MKKTKTEAAFKYARENNDGSDIRQSPKEADTYIADTRREIATAHWVAVYRKGPLAVLPGWHLQTDIEVAPAFAIFPEPLGGRKVNGRSPYQTLNALLASHAPTLLRACREALEHIEANRDDADASNVALVLESAIILATGGAK
jgi:hypothetical protein